MKIHFIKDKITLWLVIEIKNRTKPTNKFAPTHSKINSIKVTSVGSSTEIDTLIYGVLQPAASLYIPKSHWMVCTFVTV